MGKKEMHRIQSAKTLAAKSSARARVEVFLQSHAFTLTLLALYANANIILFFYGLRGELEHTSTPVMRYLIGIARAFGVTLNLNCALVLVLACRSLITFIRRFQLLHLIIPFDKLFPAFHKIVGYTILVAVLFHVIFHSSWIIFFNGWGTGLWGVTMCVGTGIALIFLLAGISALAVPRWRHSSFKNVHRLHIICALGFFPMLCLHGMWNAIPYTWKWVILPMVLYTGDRFHRHFRKTSPPFSCSMSNFKLCDGGILGVSLPRVFHFKCGQYAELQVPQIDLSYHPFTIASAPHDSKIRFYISAAGPWTKKLRNLVEAQTVVTIRYRGPYGAPAQHVSSYRHVVLVSGGVGSTPFCSIARSCNFRNSNLEDFPGAPACPDDSGSSVSDLEKNKVMINQGSSTDSLPDVASGALRGMVKNLSVKGMDLNSEDVAQCEAALRFSKRVSVATGAFSRAATGFDQENADERDDGDEARELCLDNFMLDDIEDDVTEMADSFELEPRTSNVPESIIFSAAREKWIMDDLDQMSAKRSQAQRARDKVLVTLHSVWFSLLLLWLLLGRLLVICYGTVFGWVTLFPPTVTRKSLILIDIMAGSFISGTVILTICLELWSKGLYQYFISIGRWTDFFLLVPVSLLSLFVCWSNMVKFDLGMSLTVLHFAFLLPAFTVMLCFRLYRVVGDRVLLADVRKGPSFSETKSMNFIWSTPDTKSDSWL